MPPHSDGSSEALIACLLRRGSSREGNDVKGGTVRHFTIEQSTNQMSFFVFILAPLIQLEQSLLQKLLLPSGFLRDPITTPGGNEGSEDKEDFEDADC